MPVRFLSDAQREQLSGFPAELDDEALDRFFTLSGAEVTEARQRRGEGNRLGWCVIAVGTALTGGPPRRSQRALLTHWAPALGGGVEARVGEGMFHAGGW